MDEFSTYGFDPGLRNGALVYATFQMGVDFHRCTNIITVHSWKTKDDDHLGKTAGPVEIARFVNDKLLSKMKYPAFGCGLEWEANSVYWRAQKLQVVTTAFMIGYLMRGMHTQGLPQVFFTPQQVKNAFGISAREGKEYMKRPIYLVDGPLLEAKVPLPDGKDPDVFDAFLIAYLAAEMLRQTT